MGKVTRGQALELSIGFTRDTDWDTLTSEEVQSIIDMKPEQRRALYTSVIRDCAAKRLPKAPEAHELLKLMPKPSVLKLAEPQILFDPIAEYDPVAFKSRPGLSVSGTMLVWIRANARPVKNLPAIALSCFDLTEEADVDEVLAQPNTPVMCKFADASEFIAYLDQMLSKQQNGQYGVLLSDGAYNSFYMKEENVTVYRDTAANEWVVDMCINNSSTCTEGERVFFPSPIEI